MIFIGNHLSTSAGCLAMGEAASALGGTTFAFFTRNPRGGTAKAIDPFDASALMAYLSAHSFGRLVAHAPYTMNLCSAREDVRAFSRTVLADDLARMAYFPDQYYNFHPGSHTGLGAAEGIRLIAQALTDAMTPAVRTTILLETMSGKGSEVGGRFEELRDIIDRAGGDPRLGVCLDTCHVWDAGYDLSDPDRLFTEFDRVIGLGRLRAVHLNDSMNPLSSHKDRHEKLCQGRIGPDVLRRFTTHPVLEGMPFILETPNEDEGYRGEIALVKSWF